MGEQIDFGQDTLDRRILKSRQWSGATPEES